MENVEPTSFWDEFWRAITDRISTLPQKMGGFEVEVCLLSGSTLQNHVKFQGVSIRLYFVISGN